MTINYYVFRILLLKCNSLIRLKENLYILPSEVQEIGALDPNYARAYYLRACLNSVQNNTHEAINELKSVLNLDKNLINDAKTDPDLKNLRESNEFEGILKDFEL